MVTEHGIFYRDPEACRVWGKGRISLLGDAAHLGTPLLGQGTNQTLEDAVELPQGNREVRRYGGGAAGVREGEAAQVPEGAGGVCGHDQGLACRGDQQRGDRQVGCAVAQGQHVVPAAQAGAAGGARCSVRGLYH
jgi:hypothetical protein